MNKDKYVFAQLIEFLDCFKFRRIVAKYQTDKYVKSFSCWNQLLVMIVKHDMQLDRSAYEILQIIGISLTDKTHLRDLFNKSNFNNFKERSDSSEPNLFNF